ncbi:hypothetical protein [Microbacterium sp. NPDC091676]|uniref:hypothetical protein n=1 Tax=Microbacterium sp. NPDC091676 TaxID=3364212 RepID=UPI0037FBAFEC
MSQQTNPQVLVACPRGTAHKRLVRLRRYEWSDAEGVFIRVDGEADEFYLRTTNDGVQVYPHPAFECPVAGCGRSAKYEHENFQEMLHRAAATDGVIFI